LGITQEKDRVRRDLYKKRHMKKESRASPHSPKRGRKTGQAHFYFSSTQ